VFEKNTTVMIEVMLDFHNETQYLHEKIEQKKVQSVEIVVDRVAACNLRNKKMY
jgi:hypothetical protein